MLTSLIVTVALLGQFPTAQGPSPQGQVGQAYTSPAPSTYYHSETYATVEAPQAAPCGQTVGYAQASYGAAPCASQGGRRKLFGGHGCGHAGKTKVKTKQVFRNMGRGAACGSCG
jgi:hypothetical protein